MGQMAKNLHDLISDQSFPLRCLFSFPFLHVLEENKSESRLDGESKANEGERVAG